MSARIRRAEPFTAASFPHRELDRPFGLPADEPSEVTIRRDRDEWPDYGAAPPEVVIDLPIPPSVNKTRRIDWSAKSRMDAWARAADMGVMARKQLRKVAGSFELRIVVTDSYRGDLDNICKSLIDYLRRIEVIQNDSPKYMRKFSVEFGECEGCRVTVAPIGAETSGAA